MPSASKPCEYDAAVLKTELESKVLNMGTPYVLFSSSTVCMSGFSVPYEASSRSVVQEIEPAL